MNDEHRRAMKTAHCLPHLHVPHAPITWSRQADSATWVWDEVQALPPFILADGSRRRRSRRAHGSAVMISGSTCGSTATTAISGARMPIATTRSTMNATLHLESLLAVSDRRPAETRASC